MRKINLKPKQVQSDLTDVVKSDPNATLALNGEKGLPLNPRPSDVFDEANRVLAHHKWEATGRPDGDGVEFWLEAERELKAEQSTLDFVATSATTSKDVL